MAAKIGYSKVEPISRDLLKGFKDLRREVKALREKLADLEEICAPVQVLSDMPRGTEMGNKVAEIILRKEELVEKYIAQLHELLEKEELVENWVAKLNEYDRVMIHKLYYEGKPWMQAAEEMGTSGDTFARHLQKLCLD